VWGKNSYASSYPEPPDLFLEVLCDLGDEGELGAPVVGSEGTWLAGSEIATLEFITTDGIDGDTTLPPPSDAASEEGVARSAPGSASQASAQGRR
jgi:hypothetical protein